MADLFHRPGVVRARDGRLDPARFSRAALWAYLIWVGIYAVVGSLALAFLPGARKVSAQLGLMALSLVLLVAGSLGYGKFVDLADRRAGRVVLAHRKALRETIELKAWQYVADKGAPEEIQVTVAVHDSGRFAGNVTGSRTNPAGSANVVFESANAPEDQRQVKTGDTFTYVFPLKILHEGRADDISITLYLFKGKEGPATDDVAKIYCAHPDTEDDGQFFYARLPPLPLRRDNPAGVKVGQSLCLDLAEQSRLTLSRAAQRQVWRESGTRFTPRAAFSAVNLRGRMAG